MKRRRSRWCGAGSPAGLRPALTLSPAGKRVLPLVLAALLLALPACGPAAPAESSPQPSGESAPPQETASPSVSPPPAAEPLALAWDPGGTLNPLEADAVNLELAPLVFEGLFALDETFQPQNVLCSSCSQAEDGLSWTFTLRSGVTFSDGTPLTGEIAAGCLNAARNSGLYRSRLAAVQAVRAGEGSVTVELSAPCGSLPTLLDVPVYLLPQEGRPLGTGPYRFAEYKGELSLEAVPGWWQKKDLPAERILLRQALSADDRIAAFDTGTVTLVNTDFTATDTLGYSADCETWDYATSSMVYVGFNLKEGPCAEPALRQAAARCLDRESIAAQLMAGHADPAALPAHPSSGSYSSSLAAQLAYSPEEAAKALAGGGWLPDEEGRLVKDRKPLELRLLVGSENPARAALADRLAEELRSLGITVTVQRLGWAGFLKALERGEFDLYVAQVRLTPDFDPTELLTGGLNYGGLEDEELSDLLEQYRAAGGDARTRLSYTLYSRLIRDVPFAPVCFTRGTVLTRWGRLSGLTPVQGNIFYQMENWVVT